MITRMRCGDCSHQPKRKGLRCVITGKHTNNSWRHCEHYDRSAALPSAEVVEIHTLPNWTIDPNALARKWEVVVLKNQIELSFHTIDFAVDVGGEEAREECTRHWDKFALRPTPIHN